MKDKKTVVFCASVHHAQEISALCGNPSGEFSHDKKGIVPHNFGGAKKQAGDCNTPGNPAAQARQNAGRSAE